MVGRCDVRREVKRPIAENPNPAGQRTGCRRKRTARNSDYIVPQVKHYGVRMYRTTEKMAAVMASAPKIA